MYFATWAGRDSWPSCVQNWLGSICLMEQILSLDDVSDTNMTGSQVAMFVPLCNLCGSIPKFATRKGSTPMDGLTTARATNTSSLHIGWPLLSTMPSVKCDTSAIFPGMIISLLAGISTVSATVIRYICGILSIRRHSWMVLPTVRVPALTSRVHWCSLKKSTPITIGASIADTTQSCIQDSLSVPSCTFNCTVPNVSTKLPSANLIWQALLVSRTTTSSNDLLSMDGCITLIVEPVSTNAKTGTSSMSKGKYKLPLPSVSNWTSSFTGPNDTKAAHSWASAAATSRFPVRY